MLEPGSHCLLRSVRCDCVGNMFVISVCPAGFACPGSTSCTAQPCAAGHYAAGGASSCGSQCFECRLLIALCVFSLRSDHMLGGCGVRLQRLSRRLLLPGRHSMHQLVPTGSLVFALLVHSPIPGNLLHGQRRIFLHALLRLCRVTLRF